MISKSHFVGEHIANINQYYNFIQELGCGSYGHERTDKLYRICICNDLFILYKIV